MQLMATRFLVDEQMQDMLQQDAEDVETKIREEADALKSIGRGSITSPITGAADVVDTGKMLPELDEKVKSFFPMYSGIEGAFEELSNLGISRENAVDLIRKFTNNKIDLKGDTGEFIGEFISPVAATKAVGAIASSAAKYGTKAAESVSRIAGEAKKLFSDAGGFDDLAVATAGSPSAQTAKMLDSPELPDTSVTKIIIGSSGRDYEKKSKAYESAKKELSPFGSNDAPVSDSEAQELWNRTGAQQDLVDNDIVYEIPTRNAKLKLATATRQVADSPFDYDAGRVTYNPQVKTTLSDILDFDELFEQAPYLKDIEVKKVSGIQRLFGTKAGYNPADNTIHIADGTPKELTSDLLHEVEHAVQTADGKQFDGGNFNRIMREDPEFKKLGGQAGINNLNSIKRELVDDYGGPVNPGNLKSAELRESVRNFLDTYGTLPEPNRFIKEVKKLSTHKDSKHGGGTFSYLSDIREWMDENFPDVEYEYESKIADTIKYIKTASARDLKNIIKDYNKNNLEGLERYKKIKERAILKYMRDPGEVTARNVQFRFKLSQADPSITRVAPRFTEDKAASPLQVPDVRDGKIDQPRRESQRYTDPEVLRDKARELGVPLSDDNILPIAEGQRYYLASKAEQGGDTAQSLAEQTDNMISVFPKPERMFPEGERPKGGDYLNPQTGEVLSGRNVSSANIKINPDGRPSFKVSDDNIDEVGSVGKGKSNIKVNLFKKKAGWKWDSAPDEYKDIGTLVSVEHKGKHFYTLETDFSKGVTLKKYPDSKTEPRLRPTVVGNIEIGEEVGSISVRGKKHPVYGKITTFNKGGAVPMNTMAKQMELFDEGGLMDEGGTVDPISGNEVPLGSTQEEVRDDVPAQLSEGEFVFPADVVRYIGLETLMRMRQEAKMGLAQMEAMGQMGKSEEATIPDDLPFDMYDLEVEDDGLEMQVGGSVPAAPTPTSNAMSGTPASTVGGFVNQIQPLGGAVSNLGIAPSPVTAASATQVDPNLQGTQFTPTSINPVTPTFQQQIGAGVVGVDYEFVEYTNEAGQTIRLRKNKATGQMIDPVPEGFSEKVKEEEVVETTPTTGVGTQTTRVADDGGRGDDDVDPNLGASIALGGKAVGKPEGIGIPFTRYAGPSRRTVGATTFNVQFDIPGFTPNPVSIGSFYKDMLSKDGAGLPKDGVARISVRGGTVGAHKVRVSAIDYNKIRNDVTGNLAKDYQAAGNLAEALQNGSITYDGSKQSFVDNDGNKISDDLAKGLDILGESIYADVRDDTDKGDSMIEAGQNLSASEKSALSAYNDKQFSDFFDDGGKDDTPSAPSGPSAGTPGSQASQVGVGRGPGGEDRGGGRDTSVDRGGPGASPDRGDTGRNTAR